MRTRRAVMTRYLPLGPRPAILPGAIPGDGRPPRPFSPAVWTAPMNAQKNPPHDRTRPVSTRHARDARADRPRDRAARPRGSGPRSAGAQPVARPVHSPPPYSPSTAASSAAVGIPPRAPRPVVESPAAATAHRAASASLPPCGEGGGERPVEGVPGAGRVDGDDRPRRDRDGRPVDRHHQRSACPHRHDDRATCRPAGPDGEQPPGGGLRRPGSRDEGELRLVRRQDVGQRDRRAVEAVGRRRVEDRDRPGPAGAGAARHAPPAGPISRQASTTSPGPRPSADESRFHGRSGRRRRWLPAATAIRFSARSSTTIRATPVGRPTVARWVTSIPSSTSAARAAMPRSSPPTAPTNATEAPSRAAATAWLAPLPP